MKVRINVELRNGAYHGSTMTKVITVDDEDVEDCTEAERDEIISQVVEDHVLEGMVGWDWKIVP